MKKILNALFLTLLAVFTFSSCSDVPAPYEILGEGDVPGLTGKGTQDDPYTVSDLKAKADGSTVAWVQAYIVAGIKSATQMSISSADDVVFGTHPVDVKGTAFLIAENPTEVDYKNCCAVNLNGNAAGCSAVKAALNLADNNTIELPRLIRFKGTFVKNTWGLPGLKEVTAAILEDGTVVGEGGSDTPTDENNPFGLDASNPVNDIKADFEEQSDFVKEGEYSSNLNYDYALDGWKNVAYVGDRKWTGVVYKDNTKYIQASANKGKDATYTSWFVSPAFTVNNIKDKTISFDCAGAYFYATTTLKVYFLELVNGVMQKTEIPVTGIPTSGDIYVWNRGIEINLESYSGKVGFIGFEYVAEGGEKKSTTYQIDNIKSGKSEGGGEVPTPPIEGTKIFAETFGTITTNTNVEGYTGWDNPSLTFSVNNAKVNIRSSAHKTEANKGETAKISNIWFPNGSDNNNTFTISNINAAGYNKFMLYYEIAANIYDAGSSIDLNVLKIAFNGTEVVADSKVVTAAVKGEDANIFYEMQVELNVAGTENSTLEFTVSGADNTTGLRLANIRLYAVEGGGGTDPTPSEGDGTTIDTPYNVLQAQANQNEQAAYVTGYIVGGIKNDNSINSIKSADDVVLGEGGTAVRATAVLIADSKDETDYTKCVVVNLPSGTVRQAINLQDNADNLKKKLTIKGKLKAYFGISGVKDVNKTDQFKLE